MSTISLDIGSKNLHLAEGSFRNGILDIKNSLVAPMPASLTVDGKIEDKVLIREYLNELFQKNSIKSREAIVTLQSTSVIVREFVLPVIDNSRLGNVVRYEMEQYLQPPASDYVTEFKILSQFTEEGVNKYRIRAAAMPKEMVDDYHSLLENLKFKPVALDLNFNAADKLINSGILRNPDKRDLSECIAILDIGFSKTTVNIYSKGILEINRIISYGGRDIDTVLASSFDISLEIAEQKKNKDLKLSFPGDSSESMEDASVAVRNITTLWFAEIQKVFQFFQSRNPGNLIESVYIYGGMSNLNGLTEYISQQFNVHRVQKLSNISTTNFKGYIREGSTEYLINALGALIR